MADTGEDEVVEQDPEGRYYRYKESVGKGRFKHVFKSFDCAIGIDVAWSKINADSDSLHLTEDQLQAVVREIQKGLELDHPNIIKCFKCWEDYDQHCINLITELFTSGNLRQYRNLHKHLDLKAVKRMARQILRGLEYLHSMQPPITHGDLRCDKIYVNGHNGEIKIGDLGMATLLPYRWQQEQQLAGEGGTSTSGPPPSHTFDAASDIFSFGLCMLELLTLKRLDPQHHQNLEESLAEVQDDESRQFVAKCLSPVEQRPTAMELLEDPFLSVKKVTAPGDNPDMNASLNASTKSLHDAMDKRKTEDSATDPQDGGAPIAVGKLRGEDYNFEFHGKVKDGKMHFRLVMTEAAAPVDAGPDAQPFMRTIDFVFDPEIDTADNLAAEISENFNLSPTDTEICAAALREWLAKEMPGTETGGK
uniref:non-specific serine/threonine protein kinase n=1 Tax=Chlamydomonas leiostraca TaxID=1034604 RepID=A0A7S0RFX1_9CHLO|mmetsp:Transcript_210/g.488  ORF Transcript_210/g.488 Transcript_210/m.488 type:complete len:420 (+) Transcript_210:231-1490(+)